MDILAHMLWTNYGLKPINAKRKVNKLKKINVGHSMLWSIFPDLFAFGIPTIIAVVASIFSSKFSLNTFFIHHTTPNLFSLDLPAYLYQYSHSLIIWIIVFGILWIIRKKPYLALFGWLLHICIDIFSHAPDFYPTPIFFPISNIHFMHGIRWNNPYFMIINYSLIAIVGAYFYIIKRKEYE